MRLPLYTENPQEMVPYSGPSAALEPIKPDQTQIIEQSMQDVAVTPTTREADAIAEDRVNGKVPVEEEMFAAQQVEDQRSDKIKAIDHFLATGEKLEESFEPDKEQLATLNRLQEMITSPDADGHTKELSRIAFEDLYNRWAIVAAQRDSMVRAYEKYNDQGGIATAMDFIPMMTLPFYDWRSMNVAASEFTGEGLYANPYSAIGDMARKYREIELAGNPADIKEASDQLYDIIRDHSGLFGINEMQAAMLYEMVVDYPVSQEGISSTDAELGAMMLADVLPLLPIKLAAKGVKKLNAFVNPYASSRIASRANEVHPSVADAIAQQALETGNDAMDALGIDATTIVDRLNTPRIIDVDNPNPTKLPAVGGMYKNLSRKMREMREATGSLKRRFSTRPELYTATERAEGVLVDLTKARKGLAPNFASAVLRSLNDINTPNGVQLHLNGGTRAVATDDGAWVDMIFGFKPDEGFLDFDEAYKHASSYFGKDEKISIYKRDPGRNASSHVWTGTTMDLPDNMRITNVQRQGATLPPGEYYVHKLDLVPYSADYKTFMPFNTDAVRYAQGKWLGYIMSNSARISKEYIEPSFTGNHIRDLVFQKMSNILKPYISLNNTPEMARLQDLMQQYEGIGTIPAKELSTLSEKAQAAYMSRRHYEDVVYTLKNERAYRRNKAEGFKTIVLKDGQRITSKLLSDVGDITEAFDPVTQKIVKVDKTAIADGKKFVVETRYPYYDSVSDASTDVKKTLHMVVDSNTTKVRALDTTQMPYIPGHMTRVYADPWFVRAKFKIHGTNDYETMTLRAVSSKAAAQNTMDTLKASNPEYEFDFKAGRELGLEQTDAAYSAIDTAKGKMMGSRGIHLEDEFGNLATTKDPANAVADELQYLSKHLAMDDVITLQKQRWIDRWANQNDPDNLAVSKDYGKFAESADLISKPEAKMMWDYIQNSLVKTAEESFRENMMILYAKYSGKEQTMLNKVMAGSTKFLGENNLSNKIRALNFTTMVISAVPRQFMLNARQWTMIAPTNPGYFLSSQAFKDINAFAWLAMRRAMEGEVPKDAYGKLAKLTGRDSKELQSMYEAFRDSGILAEVDHFDFAGNLGNLTAGSASRNTRAGAAIKYGKMPAQLIARGAKKAGFDSGEYINRMVTWLSEYDLATRVNKMPKRRRTTYRSVDAATEAKVGSLNRTDTFNYQNNVLKFITQFWPIQHKATQLMTTSRMVTRKQKVQMAAGQLAYYGMSGFGLKKLADVIIEEAGLDTGHPATKMVEHGLSEWVLNAGLTKILDEDVNLDLTSSFPVATIVDTVLETYVQGVATDKAPLELWGGATGATVNKFRNAYGVTIAMHKAGDLTNPDTLDDMMQTYLEIFSGVSSYTAMKASAILGTAVNKYGTPYSNEIYSNMITEAARLFGVRTKEENLIWELNKESLTNIKSEVAYKEDAHHIFQLDFKDFLDLAENVDVQSQEAQDFIYAKMAKRSSAMQTYYAGDLVMSQGFSEAYAKLWQDAFSKDNVVAEKLYKLITGGGDVDVIEKLRKRALSLNMVTEEEADRLAEAMNNWRIN